MVYAIGCQFNSPDAHQLNQDDSSSRSESPWPVQGPTVSNSQLNTEIEHRAHELSKAESEICDGHISQYRDHIASNQVSAWSSRRVLEWRVDIGGDRSHAYRFAKRGRGPPIFKS